MNPVYNSFDTHSVHYATVSDRGAINHEYARIDFFFGGAKVGQILFGNSVNPGNYASVGAGGEIDIYFPLTRFADTYALVRAAAPGKGYLYVDFDPSGSPDLGGVRLDS